MKLIGMLDSRRIGLMRQNRRDVPAKLHALPTTTEPHGTNPNI
jgi:hypothetical protein